MIRNIYKYKIPQDCAYVTKTSRIEAWIEKEGIITDVWLDYGALLHDYVLNVHFYLPSFGIPYEHLQIGIGKVKKEIVGAVRECIESEVFPALTSWVKHIQALDKSSAMYKEKSFYVQWKESHIKIAAE